MKLWRTIIIAACMIAQATLHIPVVAMQPTTSSTFDPAKTKIFFDFDDVLAQKDSFFKVKIASQGLGLHFWPYIQGLKGIRKSLTKDANGNSLIVDEAKNRYNGSTLQLIKNGIQYPALRPYIDNIIKVTGKAHTFIDGIPTLLDTLKSKHYSLNIATNKGNIDLNNAIDGMLYGKKETMMRDAEDGEDL